MKNFRGREDAVSSVIGVVLLLGLTVVMVSIIALSVFAFGALQPQQPAPQAKIEVREARGNIANLTGNEVVLIHKGGDNLYPDKVKIVIRGTGKEALKSGGDGGIGSAPTGSITITYNNLEGYNYVNYSGTRKDNYFLGHEDLEFAKIIQGDVWTAGEKIVLYGADGKASNYNNSVNKKWELNPGSSVTITPIDIPTSQVIAVASAKVKVSGQVVGS